MKLTWSKPNCKDCPHIYYSEKGPRCYAIYPYIGLRTEYLNQHHRKCPVTNYFEDNKGLTAKPSVLDLYTVTK